MFGKGILKIIGLAIAGAMALAGASQVLSSVAHVIISFRSGDFIPLALAIGTTIALIQLKRMLTDNTLSTIVGILVYAASGYLMVVAFVGLLPYGIVSSLIGAALTILICSVLHDPSPLNEWMGTLSTDSSMSLLSRNSNSSDFSSSLDVSHRLVLIPPGSLKMVIELMRDRPLLPISLTHFNDCNVLFIDTNIQSTKSSYVKGILERVNIPLGTDASPLLREAILKVPLIDEKHGLSMNDYCLATEESTVEHLLRNIPSRMMVFPSRTGLRIIYPESAVPGLISQKIPDNELVNALLLHSYANLQEVDGRLANPA